MALYAAESPRLYLQPLNLEQHLDDYHLIMTSPEANAWSIKAYHTDIQQTFDLIRASTPSPEKPWNKRWAILLKNQETEAAKPRLIGIMGIVREQEIGYKLHPDYWRKGYGSEALGMFVQLFWSAEENAKYDRLLAAADAENIASVKTLLRAGFQKSEYRKEFYERASEPGVKRDLQCFYLERPSS